MVLSKLKGECGLLAQLERQRPPEPFQRWLNQFLAAAPDDARPEPPWPSPPDCEQRDYRDVVNVLR